MSTHWLLSTLVVTLLLPPGGPLVLALLAGMVAWRMPRWRRPAGWVLGIALIVAWLAATPWCGRLLASWTHPAQPVRLDALQPHGEGAVVLLGGSRKLAAREYAGQGETALSGLSLERTVYAARLAHAARLPVLATGGAPQGLGVPEAELMGRLVADLGQDARWIETRSATTEENAAFSAPMLRAAGIQRIYLVTHYWHMARARRYFEGQGLIVTPAPCGWGGEVEESPVGGILSLLPRTDGLALTRSALREALGQLWLSMRQGIR
ncbi:YdcF family protein [Ralstonia solanacearum]|uniref:YdcF family protein n=1 Tax=Ralstonia solanacearum TaxID=305 RepID=UPI0018D0E672|nr:YdcF family protein [Ralstonia solanacearum]